MISLVTLTLSSLWFYNLSTVFLPKESFASTTQKKATLFTKLNPELHVLSGFHDFILLEVRFEEIKVLFQFKIQRWLFHIYTAIPEPPAKLGCAAHPHPVMPTVPHALDIHSRLYHHFANISPSLHKVYTQMLPASCLTSHWQRAGI